MADDYVQVTLRFGGYWKKAKGSFVYAGGLSKNFTVEVDRTSLKDFTDEIYEKCPELHNCKFNLAFEIPGSKPPSYAWIHTDSLYLKMLLSHNGTYKVVVFLDLNSVGKNEGKNTEDPLVGKQTEVTEENEGKNIEVQSAGKQTEATEISKGKNMEAPSAGKQTEATEENKGKNMEAPSAGKQTEACEGGEKAAAMNEGLGEINADPIVTPSISSNIHVGRSVVEGGNAVVTPRRSPRLMQFTTPSSSRRKVVASRRRKQLVEVPVMGKMTCPDLDEDNYVNVELFGYADEGVNKEILVDAANDCEAENNYREVDSSEDEADRQLMDDDSEVVKSDEDVFEKQLNARDPPIHVGRKFLNKWEFRSEIRQHAIVNNFEAKFVKNEGRRFVIVCAAENCAWRLRAVVMSQDRKTIEIRTLSPKHTCVGVNRIGNNQATANWIAKQICKKVKDNRDYRPKAIADFLREEFQLVNIPYGRLWLAREIARDLVYGKVEENYKLVPSLAEELKRRNPGSHIAFSLDSDGSFSRFFVSFGQCIDGFKNFCRPFLGVDGCHLRSKYLGVLLAATALDGNNGLYPVAFAVVEGESLDSWSWFFKNLNEALGGEIEGMTIMSDMEKGLEEALRRVMPKTEHRVCMRHLWKSFKKRFPGDVFERLVWTIAKAFNEVERKVALEELKETSVHAYHEICSKGRDVSGIRKWVWSRCEFSKLSRNHYITNNISESFNAWVLEARSMPVCDLIDNIRGKIMKKFDLRKRLCTSWGGVLTPIAEKNVVDLSRNLPGYVISRANEFEYEVDDGVHRNLVHVENKNCTCNRWQMTGLPRSHALAIISGWMNPDWSKYVDKCYHKCSYEGAYAKGIGPMPSKEHWLSVDAGCDVGPPNTKRPRGRPKKERIRGDEESRKGQVSKRVHQCTRCAGWGHHKNSCKNPIGSQEQNQRSTTIQSQGREKKKRVATCSQGSKTRRKTAELEYQATATQSSFAQEQVTRGASSQSYVDPWKAKQINISPINPSSRAPVEHRGKREPLRGKGASSKRLIWSPN